MNDILKELEVNNYIPRRFSSLANNHICRLWRIPLMVLALCSIVPQITANIASFLPILLTNTGCLIIGVVLLHHIGARRTNNTFAASGFWGAYEYVIAPCSPLPVAE